MAARKPTSDLVVELVAISSLSPDPENARKHGERNLTAIRKSLEGFGQRKPIVATKTGVVIAGNGTLEAAVSLGWEQIAVVRLPWDDIEKARAYALADNRTGELAAWDDQLLLSHLTDLRAGEIDLATIGFTEADLVAIQGRVARNGPPDEFDSYDEDLETAYECPRCGYEWSGQAHGGPDTG